MDIFQQTSIFLILFITTYFEVFLLLVFLGERKRFRPSVREERLFYPSITIIVPAWNEEHTLAGTVDSLLAVDYPKDKLSIFIVDDGSTDNTRTVAEGFSVHPQVKVFSKQNGGKHTAMNLGISAASSDLIGCLDADSFADPASLKEVVPYFDDPETMAVTPSVQIHNPDNVLRRIQSTEYMVGEFTRKVFSRLNALYVTPGPLSIYRKEVFEKIGGFEHSYGTEDMEMALRMQSHHMKIENAHTAFVYTVCPATPRALYKQRVRWVSGFLKNAFFKYRFMFLNKKYGHLGILTVPFAFGSIFIALFFTGLYVISLWQFGADLWLRWSALGWQPHFRWPRFDWFSLSMDFKTIIIYLLVSITILFIALGARLVTHRKFFSVNTLWFLALYGFIAPFWLARSLYNLITSQEANWR
jgi:cellulose synthase/poly-beta-1,6-N-acetylglucosamine synthase-like glycosyltransferase